MFQCHTRSMPRRQLPCIPRYTHSLLRRHLLQLTLCRGGNQHKILQIEHQKHHCIYLLRKLYKVLRPAPCIPRCTYRLQLRCCRRVNLSLQDNQSINLTLSDSCICLFHTPCNPPRLVPCIPRCRDKQILLYHPRCCMSLRDMGWLSHPKDNSLRWPRTRRRLCWRPATVYCQDMINKLMSPSHLCMYELHTPDMQRHPRQNNPHHTDNHPRRHCRLGRLSRLGMKFE